MIYISKQCFILKQSFTLKYLFSNYTPDYNLYYMLIFKLLIYFNFISIMERQQETIDENIIRVTHSTNVERAIERIEKALQTFDKVILSAINSGIPNVVLIAEIAKVKIADLHQLNTVETLKTSTKDNEGTDGRERISTRFKIELSKNKPTVPQGSFYQAPYSKDEVNEILSVKTEDRGNEGGFRGRGRGRGRGFRGRGRGEGFRGRGEGFRGRGEGFRGRGEGFRGRGEGFRGRGEGFRGGRGEGFRGGRGGEFRN